MRLRESLLACSAGVQTLAELPHQRSSAKLVDFVREASLLEVSPLCGLQSLERLPNLRRNPAMAV